jgi:Flp pilus assembly protein TadG
MNRPGLLQNRLVTRHGQLGLAAVEFVICAPLLLLLLLGCAELGRAFIHYATLSYTIRDSARFVTTNSINGTTGIVQLSTTTITRAKNLAVYGNVGGTGAPRLPNYQVSHVAVQSVGGGNIRVTGTYPYQPMLGPVLPGFGQGGAVPLNFSMVVAATMRAIS